MPETIEKLGMGWLSYEYILTGLPTNFCPLLKPEWLDTGEFRT